MSNSWLSSEQVSRCKTNHYWDFMIELDIRPTLVWADHADYISKAYSGTPALKTDFTRTGKRTYEGLGRDFMSSVKRYLKNNFYDGDRHDAFDLVTGAWVAKGGPSASLALVHDNRPPIVKAMPYILGLSIAIFVTSLSLPQSLTSMAYLRILCLIFASLSALYIFIHGIEYVAWPRLNPPVDVIHYDGPGYKSPQRGRGQITANLPIPKWIRKHLVSSMKSSSSWNKLEEVEMGTKMRVD
ncbi:hypothetical protein FRC03_003637 [Tulasnella sp. 419]|nr:hypothetical protein FRC03_003637 [Tulasnella sp. 419]